MKEEIKTITVTKEYYMHLIETMSFLDILELAGVENWEGYDQALEEFNKLREAEKSRKLTGAY